MRQNNNRSYYESLRTFVYRLEDTLLIGLLLLIMGLAVTQIFLRNILETGIVWGDVLLRILVLWIGLAGAMAASRKGEHISIDILKRYLPEKAARAVTSIVELFTAVICITVSYFSLKFVIAEFEDGGTAFANLPVWVCEAIIPFAFMVIALRYFLLFIGTLSGRIRAAS